VLGVILLVLDDSMKISIVFWTIGLIVLAIGIVILIVDQKSRRFGRRRFRY
jgi:hypothetical protein